MFTITPTLPQICLSFVFLRSCYYPSLSFPFVSLRTGGRCEAKGCCSSGKRHARMHKQSCSSSPALSYLPPCAWGGEEEHKLEVLRYAFPLCFPLASARQTSET